MKAVTIRFNNGVSKTYKVADGTKMPEDLILFDLNTSLLHRYIKIDKASELLPCHYFQEKSKVNALDYFGAKQIGSFHVDGRSAKVKAMNYFSIEEVLKNYN